MKEILKQRFCKYFDINQYMKRKHLFDRSVMITSVLRKIMYDTHLNGYDLNDYDDDYIKLTFYKNHTIYDIQINVKKIYREQKLELILKEN